MAGSAGPEESEISSSSVEDKGGGRRAGEESLSKYACKGLSCMVKGDMSIFWSSELESRISISASSETAEGPALDDDDEDDSARLAIHETME